MWKTQLFFIPFTEIEYLSNIFYLNNRNRTYILQSKIKNNTI